ncbi:hypothetical protein UFOVP1269_11 [uncultured Caudovirales phage]|uniref:Uncharacterized protein n=1 Tax=uncultured Caudovirales phage TaxID=2100421 RepID=A0A6J5RBH9_9CAUD|nr:hypothetical protein UFOVP1269_11 [uncultured Caudovirales phage]
MSVRPTFTSGQVLTAAEQNVLASAIVAINAQTGTTYTVVASDVGKLITASNAAAIALTIPQNVFAVGDQINIMQGTGGSGVVTITAGAGVTLQSNGSKLKTNGQYAVATVLCIASNTFVVLGNLVA